MCPKSMTGNEIWKNNEFKFSRLYADGKKVSGLQDVEHD